MEGIGMKRPSTYAMQTIFILHFLVVYIPLLHTLP